VLPEIGFHGPKDFGKHGGTGVIVEIDPAHLTLNPILRSSRKWPFGGAPSHFSNGAHALKTLTTQGFYQTRQVPGFPLREKIISLPANPQRLSLVFAGHWHWQVNCIWKAGNESR
jgi:hypothetical protein